MDVTVSMEEHSFLVILLHLPMNFLVYSWQTSSTSQTQPFKQHFYGVSQSYGRDFFNFIAQRCAVWGNLIKQFSFKGTKMFHIRWPFPFWQAAVRKCHFSDNFEENKHFCFPFGSKVTEQWSVGKWVARESAVGRMSGMFLSWCGSAMIMSVPLKNVYLKTSNASSQTFYTLKSLPNEGLQSTVAHLLRHAWELSTVLWVVIELTDIRELRFY